MTPDEMKQMLIQKYEEILQKSHAFRSLPVTGSPDVGCALLWRCKQHSQILNLDKETEYLLVAVNALEQYQNVTEMLIEKFNTMLPEPVTVEGVTYKYIGPWPPA